MFRKRKAYRGQNKYRVYSVVRFITNLVAIGLSRRQTDFYVFIGKNRTERALNFHFDDVCCETEKKKIELNNSNST